MKALLLLSIIILILFTSRAFKLPCSVITLSTELIGMPCTVYEINTMERNYLSNYIDVNTVKTLAFSGWFYLNAPAVNVTTTNLYTIFSIQNYESATYYLRYFNVEYSQYFRYLYSLQYNSQINPTASYNYLLNAATTTIYAQIHNKWLFMVGSIDNNAHFQSLALYVPSGTYTISAFQVPAVSNITSFHIQTCINWGANSLGYTKNYLLPGCGQNYNIRLYPNLHFSASTQLNLERMMQNEAQILIYYPLTMKGLSEMLIDISGNLDHSGTATQTILQTASTLPIWYTNNEGLRVNNKQYLNLNTLLFQKYEFQVSFWFRLLSVNVQKFSLLTALNAGTTSQEVFGIKTLVYLSKTQLVFTFMGTQFNLTSFPTSGNYATSTWYFFFSSCFNYYMQNQFVCNFRLQNGVMVKNIFPSAMAKTYLLIRIGDPLSTGSSYFLMKNLLISDGGMFDIYDAANTQCLTNCQTILVTANTQSRCLVCNTNYHEQGGQCILSTSCATKDANIPKCRVIVEQCNNTLLLPPACTSCINGYILINSTCVQCPYKCANCDTSLQCTTCGSSRESAALPNCQCTATQFDDLKFPQCVEKTIYKLPSKIKYLPLTQTTFTSVCNSATESMVNRFTYTDLDGPQIASMGATSISFTLWVQPAFQNDYQSFFLLRRQPFSSYLRLINLFHRNANKLLYVYTSDNVQSYAVYQTFAYNDWNWVFVTLDAANLGTQMASYTPRNHMWYYKETTGSPFATIDYPDMLLYIGTQAYQQSTTWCTCKGAVRDLFLYYSYTANQVNMNTRTLRQMMKIPDSPYFNFTLINNAFQQQYDNTIATITGKLIMGSTTDAEVLKDPGYHWYNGIVFGSKKFSTITTTTLTDFNIHYWISKAVVDVDFITIYRKSSTGGHLFSIHHMAKPSQQIYLLQVCIAEKCIQQPKIKTTTPEFQYYPMRTQLWHFICVSVSFNTFDEHYVEMFIGSRLVYAAPIYNLVNIAQATDTLTLGSDLNLNNDPFYIKDIGIDQGGALFNIYHSGFSTTVLPNCLLKSMQNIASGLNSTLPTTQYCLLCEWGYYVNKGACLPGKNYCNLLWTDCIPDCPEGKYADPTIFDCVSTCTQAGYFKDPTTRVCTKVCSPGTYACNQTNVCETNCPNGLFGDPVSKYCVVQCPNGTFGLLSQGKCLLSCPTGIFEDDQNWLCTCLCPGIYFGDPDTNKCVDKCPDGKYGFPPNKLCQPSCEHLYADNTTSTCVSLCPQSYYGNSITHFCGTTCPSVLPLTDPSQRLCVTKCETGLFADLTINNCTNICPKGYYADQVSGTCSQSCHSGLYWYPEDSMCLKICPDTTFTSQVLGKCVENCTSSPGTFAELQTRTCAKFCLGGLFGNPLTSTCDVQCPLNYYADETSTKCVSQCPNQFFAIIDQRVCSKTCPSGLYSDQTTSTCNTDCPVKYRKSLTSNQCLGDCASDEYYHLLSDSCVTACPEGYFSDPETFQCLQMDFSCSTQYCIHPVSHLCVKMSMASTFVARVQGTYMCTQVDQAVGVDECLLSVQEYCVFSGLSPTSCIYLANNTKNNQTNVCDCSPGQCIEKINSTYYICVNITNTVATRIGREKETKFCLAADDFGLEKGADLCAVKYCIEPEHKSCTSMNESSSLKYFARQKDSLACLSTNDPQDIDDCAPGNFCVDLSFEKSQCIFIDNLDHIYASPTLNQAKFCNCDSALCKIPANLENFTFISLLDSEVDNPIRKGKEKTSLNCLQVNQSGTYGAIRCAYQHCIDSSSKSCVRMNLNKYQGRKKADFSCVEINDAVGVDQCTYNSTYCIDIQSDPSRCSDLDSPLSCYIGREKGSQICVFEQSSGPSTLGVDYCKKGFCIYQKILSQSNGTGDATANTTNSAEPSTCEALADRPGLRAKNATTHCTLEIVEENMIECSQSYCIDSLQQYTCQRFSRLRLGKDKDTGLCLGVGGTGSREISECAEDFCKIKRGDLYYCIELDKLSTEAIAKENNTHNCLSIGQKSSLGILQCAPDFCIFEVGQGEFICSQQQTFSGSTENTQALRDLKSKNFKKLSACKTVEISDYKFDALNLSQASLFEIIDSPSVVISNLTISNAFIGNGSKVINIVNAQNVSITGELHLENVTLSEGSSFLFLSNATVHSLGSQSFKGITLSQNSKFVDARNTNNLTMDSFTVENTIFNKGTVAISLKCALGNTNINGQNAKNITLRDSANYLKIRGCDSEDDALQNLITYNSSDPLHQLPINLQNIIIDSDTNVQNANLIDASDFSSIKIQNFSFSSVSLKETSRLMTATNGKSIDFQQLNIDNIQADCEQSAQALQLNSKSKIALFETFNVSQIIIGNASLSNSSLLSNKTSPALLFKVEYADNVIFQSFSILNNSKSSSPNANQPFAEFSKVKNLRFSLFEQKNINSTSEQSSPSVTTDYSSPSAIHIHDSDSVIIDALNIQDVNVSKPLIIFSGIKNLQLIDISFTRTYPEQQQLPDLGDPDLGGGGGGTEESTTVLRRRKIYYDQFRELLQQSVQPMEYLTPLFYFENSQFVSISGNISANFSGTKYQLASYKNCEEVNLSGVELLDQIINTTKPIMEFYGITKSLIIQNVLIQNINFINAESSIIRIIDCNNILLQDFVINNVNISNNFARISQVNNSQFSNYSISKVRQFQNLSSIILDDEGNIEMPLIDLTFFLFEAVHNQKFSKIIFNDSEAVSLLISQNDYNVLQINQTQSFRKQSYYTFQWSDTFINLEQFQVNQVIMRDTNTIKLQATDIIIADSNFSLTNCTTCNGSAIHIYDSNFTLSQLSVNSGGALSGGALYAVNCPKKAELFNSSFTNNSASLSGGAILFDEVFFYMQDNNITFNKALIGGGIRFLGLIPNTTSNADIIAQQAAAAANASNGTTRILNNHLINVNTDSNEQYYYSYYKPRKLISLDELKNSSIQFSSKNNTITNNSAIIYGRDTACYLGGIMFNTTLNGLIPELIQVDKIRSGQTLDNYFNITLIDQQGELVNITQANMQTLLELTNNNVPPTITVNEFQQTIIQVQYDLTQIVVKGDMLKSFQFNFDYYKIQFQFQQLLLIGMPNQISQFFITSQSVMLPNNISGKYENQPYSIMVKIGFRECIMGEIYTRNLQFYECTPCGEGQYSLEMPNKNNPNQICKDCPYDKAKSCRGSQILLRPGFWRKSIKTDLILSCENEPANCIGGIEGGNLICFEGHIGALCEECDITQSFWSTTYSRSGRYGCALCSEMQFNHILLALQTLWTFVSLMISIKIDLRASQHLIKNHVRVQALDLLPAQYRNKKTREKLPPPMKIDAVSPLLKVLINYLQVVSCIAKLEIYFPYGIMSVPDQIGKPIQQSMYSTDCAATGNTFGIPLLYFRVIISLILSISYQVVFVFLYVSYVIIFRKKFNSYIFTTSFMFFIVYLQPEIVSSLLSIVSCRTIGDTEYILGNVSYECYTDQFMYYALILVLPFITLWVFILPLTILSGLYSNRENLNKMEVRLKYGFMFREFKLNYYYWEFVKMYMKIMITIILNQYAMDIRVKGSLIVVVITIYAVFSATCKPFKQLIVSKMDILTMIISGMSVFLGVFMYKNQYTYWILISFILLIIINIYCIFKLLLNILTELSPAFEDSLDKCKIGMMSDYPFLESVLNLSKRHRLKQFWDTLKRNLLFKAKYNKLKPSPAFGMKQKKKSEEIQLINPLNNDTNFDSKTQTDRMQLQSPKKNGDQSPFKGDGFQQQQDDASPKKGSQSPSKSPINQRILERRATKKQTKLPSTTNFQ